MYFYCETIRTRLWWTVTATCPSSSFPRRSLPLTLVPCWKAVLSFVVATSLFCGTVPLVFCMMSTQKWESPCLCRCVATQRSMYFLFTLFSLVPSLSSPGRVRGALCALSEGSKLSSMLWHRPSWWNTVRFNCGTKCRWKASRSCLNPFRRVREKCGLKGR